MPVSDFQLVSPDNYEKPKKNFCLNIQKIPKKHFGKHPFGFS